MRSLIRTERDDIRPKRKFIGITVEGRREFEAVGSFRITVYDQFNNMFVGKYTAPAASMHVTPTQV